MGMPETTLMVIPGSETGAACLKATGLDPSTDASTWRMKIEEQRSMRQEHRKKAFTALADQTNGISDLDAFFADCINCHNCMRVCPICYCRQCFFDSSDTTRIEADTYLNRADTKGGITFPADKLLFHIGRMSHMTLSCIGCGSCEDACAMDVPVSQLFIYLADKTQQMFNYVAGRNSTETIPVLTYKENELHEYEDAREQS
jgi:formate dehydrogenase subunit beta